MSLDHRRPTLTLRVWNLLLWLESEILLSEWLPNRSIQVSVTSLSIITTTPTWFACVSVGFFCSISPTLTPPDWSSSPVIVWILKKELYPVYIRPLDLWIRDCALFRKREG